MIDSYAKPNGIEAVYVEGASNDHLAKARAQKSSPQMDLFVGNDQTFAVAKSLDLLAKVDPKLVPNILDVAPAYRDKDGFGQFYEINPVGLVYRTDKFKEAASTSRPPGASTPILPCRGAASCSRPRSPMVSTT